MWGKLWWWFECQLSSWEKIWISGCLHQREFALNSDLFKMASLDVIERPGLWLSGCLPGVSVCACPNSLSVHKWVCLCVGACRSSFVVCKLNPPHTPSHFTPAIINHNSNWPPLTPNGPITPTIWAPISPSLSNPSLSHGVTYWAGLKLPPLSLSYTIITRLTTWNMNTPMSPRQPPKPHVISLDLGDTATSHSTQRG